MIRTTDVLFLCSLNHFISASQVPCTNQTYCQKQWGQNSQCSFGSAGYQGNCTCGSNYYLESNDNTSSCVQCPGIGESCESSQCCNQEYLVCHRDVCMCIYSEYCWSITDSERERFQHVAQCILAIALILTATILFILFWKACTRRNTIHRNLRHMSADSFLSLNSIQRLVLLQLQDRPPAYNPESTQQHGKNINEISEPPPTYIEAVGIRELNNGEDNFMFVLGELPSTVSTSRGSISSVLIPCQNLLTSANNAARRQSSEQGTCSNNLPLNVETYLQNTPSASGISLPLQNNTILATAVATPLQNGFQENTSDCDACLVVVTNSELHI